MEQTIRDLCNLWLFLFIKNQSIATSKRLQVFIEVIKLHLRIQMVIGIRNSFMTLNLLLFSIKIEMIKR